jgi:phosphodiesterase/alkaline phosphatase D-like protein
VASEKHLTRVFLAFVLAAYGCLAAQFAATSAALGPPLVTTGASADVTTTSATVTGSVNPNELSTTWSVQYGTTTGYGLQTNPVTIAAGTEAQAIAAALTGLRAGTIYHYRVIATNSAGTTVGADQSFTTAGAAPPATSPPPTASTRSATSVGSTAATLRGGVNPRGVQTSYWFEYGLTNTYGARTAPRTLSAGNSTRSVSARLSGLEPGKTYHYRVVAQNQNGLTVGSDRSFTTRAPTSTGGRPRPGLTSSVRPRRDRSAPYRFRVRGHLVLPSGVSSSACRGRVTVRFTRRGRTVRRTSARVRSTCTYSNRVRVRVRVGSRSRVLRVSVRFRGNADLRPKSAPTRRVRAG